MDLKQLEYFVHVAERGSFTRAASVVRVAQPALSRQVRALEVELRQALFDRNGRGVTLTEAGKRLLAHGRGLLQQAQRARQDLEDHRGAPTGRLALGVPPSVGRLLTLPLVEVFQRQLPQASITMVEGLSTYVLEWLVQGRIDCAVVYNVTPVAAIDLQPVLQEQLYLVSARTVDEKSKVRGDVMGRPIGLNEVAKRELVIPSRPHSMRMLLETSLAAVALKPRIGLEIESVPAILDLVERHPLHAVLARAALRGRESAFVARPIVMRAEKSPLAATLLIATSTQRPGGALIEQGTRLLRELLLKLWTG